ncbi:hypothetical protein Tco_0653143 [Tanacetum coccineum]|uniref:Zinc finger, CCHC-type n=1 Tax=Tanacetum coccineum TaxID=301880 RepID=A0ABQ4WZP6_9ASTR
MSDALFDVYQNVGSAKELWDQLESNYMIGDASSKKFFVTNYNYYKMIDSRSVIEQYHELLQILGHFTQHNLNMDEFILVSSIIDKLPPSWKDFKHSLKHNKDELSFLQLGSHFRIEESLTTKESAKGIGKEIVGSSSVNIIEDVSSGVKSSFRDGYQYENSPLEGLHPSRCPFDGTRAEDQQPTITDLCLEHLFQPSFITYRPDGKGLRATHCASLNVVLTFVLSHVIHGLAIQQPPQTLCSPSKPGHAQYCTISGSIRGDAK